MEAQDVTYFWRRKAPFECLKRELPRGFWGHAPPGNLKKKKKKPLKNIISSVSGRQVSVSQYWMGEAILRACEPASPSLEPRASKDSRQKIQKTGKMP